MRGVRTKPEARRAYDLALGRRIAQARAMKGISQRNLAAKLGISPQLLSLMERGRVSCTMFLFEKIQGVLRGDSTGRN